MERTDVYRKENQLRTELLKNIRFASAWLLTKLNIEDLAVLNRFNKRKNNLHKILKYVNDNRNNSIPTVCLTKKSTSFNQFVISRIP